eukprot:scaffold33709_cov143-Skeletonema_menzelii.AAC.2
MSCQHACNHFENPSSSYLQQIYPKPSKRTDDKSTTYLPSRYKENTPTLPNRDNEKTTTTMTEHDKMLKKMCHADGFIAALDQSGGSSKYHSMI